MPAERGEEDAVVQAVARAREGLSWGKVEPWAGPVPAWLDTSQLHYLAPPLAGRGPGADPRAGEWKSAFRPGLYTYRVGPGIIDVKDTRDPCGAARIRIDQRPLVDAVLVCEQPVRPGDQDAECRAAIGFLVSEGLAMSFGEYVITAPYRIRRWPIPTRIGL